MAVDKEAISLSRVYSYYSKCNLVNTRKRNECVRVGRIITFKTGKKKSSLKPIQYME